MDGPITRIESPPRLSEWQRRDSHSRSMQTARPCGVTGSGSSNGQSNRVLAQDDELKLNGSWRESNHQVRGTCVGQGSSRAIEDVHISRLVDKALVGKYTQIAFEVMYGNERNEHWPKTHPWGCNCRNCPDGLQGTDAAEFYATRGVTSRANYTAIGIDLSKPREDLAIQWNNTGVPAVLIAAAAFHKIECHRSMTWDEYSDPIAAKQWGARLPAKNLSGDSGRPFRVL